jgi:hypothetical protein
LNKQSVAALKNQMNDELKDKMQKVNGNKKQEASDADSSSANEAAGREFGNGALKSKQLQNN